jgi:tetratricopeptide (TPR) repeat protein
MNVVPKKSAFLGVLAISIPLVANTPAQSDSNSSLTIKSSPETIIWIDHLRYGALPASGELTAKNLRAGAHIIRTRLKGKREVTQKVALKAGAQQTVQIALSIPADKAELHFQTAEELRERGKHLDAIKEYRQAIKLRLQQGAKGGYPPARIGLARSLMSSEEYEEAVAEARRALREKSGIFPEAHTVIANTRRTQGFYDEAIASYRTALAQARNISPEAHTGIALAFQDRNRTEEAIKHLRTAIAQANDTEPIIYFLLGTALERQMRNLEAINAYEKYLQLDQRSSQASAVRSILRQLKREARIN